MDGKLLCEGHAEEYGHDLGKAGREREMRDEILEAEVRDQLRDQGLDEDSVAESLAAMRDQGMFDVPDWAP